MTIISPPPKLQFFDDNGNPLSGGKLYTYEAGTSIPLATYTDYAGTQFHTNPIILDSRGETSLWFGANQYKLKLTTPTNVEIWTVDNINAQDSTTLNALAASNGSSLVGFLQQGNSSVARTVQSKLRDFISVKDFGAVGDGANDDSDPIQAALNAATVTTFRTVYVPGGNYLITKTITIPEGVALVGEGSTSAFAQGLQGYPARFTKKAIMSSVGIAMPSPRSRIENLGVYAESGASGGGIWMYGNYSSLIRVTANGHTGEGIKVGSKPTAYANTNGWYLQQIVASYNTSHGLHIAHEHASIFDCNAGCLNTCDIRYNGGNGLLVGNCMRNTFINVLVQSNTGYGVHFTSASRQNTFVGGDTDEGNTAGNLFNEGDANLFLNVGGSGVNLAGINTQYIGYAASQFSRITSVSGLTAAQDSAGGVPAAVTLRNAGLQSSGRGISQEFYTPSGSTTAASRLAARISAYNNTAAATIDTLNIQVNSATGIKDMLRIDPFGPGGVYCPSAGVWLGTNVYPWFNIYASNPLIVVSDKRAKNSVRTLKDAETAVAKRLKSMIRAFRWNNDDGQWHIGVVAQEIMEVFESEGLNPLDYAMIRHDSWNAQDEMRDDEGNIIEPAKEAGDQYGVRYEELLAFIISAM